VSKAIGLIALGVDGLIVCGTTTSGCVRASVLDADVVSLADTLAFLRSRVREAVAV
jgi:nicotinamidase-related amidase